MPPTQSYCKVPGILSKSWFTGASLMPSDPYTLQQFKHGVSITIISINILLIVTYMPDGRGFLSGVWEDNQDITSLVEKRAGRNFAWDGFSENTAELTPSTSSRDSHFPNWPKRDLSPREIGVDVLQERGRCNREYNPIFLARKK